MTQSDILITLLYVTLAHTVVDVTLAHTVVDVTLAHTVVDVRLAHTVVDVTLAHTVVDETCNLNSGKDEMTRNETQLLIMENERNSVAMLI